MFLCLHLCILQIMKDGSCVWFFIRYLKYQKRCLSDRKKLGIGCSEVAFISVLYHLISLWPSKILQNCKKLGITGHGCPFVFFSLARFARGLLLHINMNVDSLSLSLTHPHIACACVMCVCCLCDIRSMCPHAHIYWSLP